MTTGDLGGSSKENVVLDGIPVITVNGSRFQKALQIVRLEIDVILTIDYRCNYRGIFNILPFTPVITWVRDPRTQAVIEKVNSLKIPGKNVEPAGICIPETRNLAAYRKRPFPLKNRVTLANKMSHLKEKNEDVYNIPGSEWVLPNPSVVDYSGVNVKKAEKPTVVFVGRLDPIKRPWLFVELARMFPEADFLMLGKNHFEEEDGWEINNVPENLKLLGHVTGEEKYQILSSAWIFVNTSIHEESPVSAFEALAYETPLVCFEDWGGIVSRHGISIGQRLGTGLDGMPDLVSAVKQLLNDEELRTKYGKRGRAFVEKEHNDEAFLTAFRELCIHTGVKRAKDSILV
ncbi:glycosyltransferase family 4 protein [Rhodohalobacter sp. 8-1]|uniref:glycosyltransferase family 4 protein n=1 Tax=Rhodohalobacter sp. 8-1 TaxID=3131972 RepID=UPI0030EDA5D7